MSSEDRDQRDPLQSLIAEVLEAEGRGESVDREALIQTNPECANSLREFFASHDQMKSAVEVDPPTLPPRSSFPAGEDPTIAPTASPLDDPTLPPNASGLHDATIPPNPSNEEEATMPPTNTPSAGGASVGDQIRYFGDYELLEEIARGGMGVVFKARQVNLNRIVALKMILAGQFAGEEDVQRFYTEAEAAAALDHPGIVPIFEIGEHAGQHYFSMGYIEGDSLAHKVADGPLPPREAAELVKKICDAMAYAHERGVIHRDLKPANILIDSGGQPKVTDFGLAKKTEADSGLTGTGQILGTPAYMPPEQASGKTDVGPLADVYSLGAILYCLLTGRPPFQAATPMDTLLQVLDQEPVSVRTLNPKVPVDLETISLKCLHKDARQRYAGSQALFDELQRYLDGKPILARPVGRFERTRRWCRRNPMVASLSAIAFFALVGGAIASTVFGVIATNEAQQALAAQQAMKSQLYANRIALAKSAWDSNDASTAWFHLTNCDADQQGWEHDYLYTMFQNGFVGGGYSIHSGRSANDLAMSPDGKRVVTVSDYMPYESPNRAMVVVADLADQERPRGFKGHRSSVNAVDFRSDGKLFVTGSGSSGPTNSSSPIPEIKLWEVASGKELRSLIRYNARGHMQAPLFNKRLAILDVTFSPAGDRIASAAGSGFCEPVSSFTSRQDQTRIQESGLHVWDAESGERLLSIEGHSDSVNCVAFSSDGGRLVSGSHDKTVRVWDASTGNPINRLSGHDLPLTCVAFSPDGETVASGSGDRAVPGSRPCELKLWNSASGQLRLNLYGHHGPITSLCFSPDGRLLVSSSEDRTVRVWDAASGEPLFVHQGFPKIIAGVAFHPDGKQITALSRTNTEVGRLRLGELRVMAPMQETGPRLLGSHDGKIRCLATSRDGKLVASGGEDQSIRIWDTTTETMVGEWDAQETVVALAFLPGDAGLLSYGTRDHTAFRAHLRIWDHLKGQEERTVWRDRWSSGYGPLVLSSDGSRIISRNWILEAATGRALRTDLMASSNENLLAVSPDGAQYLARIDREIGDTGAVHVRHVVFNAVTGSEVRELTVESKREAMKAKPGTIEGESVSLAVAWLAAYSPTGDRLATYVRDGLGFNGYFKIWDLKSGDTVSSTLVVETSTSGGHRGPMVFTPDGSRIAVAAGNTGRIEFYDTDSAQIVFAAQDPADRRVDCIVFAQGGKKMLTAAGNELRLWDANESHEHLAR